ncbi:MAG: heat-inducible transcriptional repressor HrcA [Bryobacterales bacterium]|nr:heat-inducible transcriptional repressor HrcA [Bryobacteraceae bacterium]MDW8355982.1 heat-inducible transcriptional repressor HrcA [Bryobacterales bacterium]
MERRKADILRSIVKKYIETGQPVASRTIAKRPGCQISAATIRNVMADLCDEGYLSQPHTSAGRVPTEKAFRFFVRELTVRRPSEAEFARLQAAFRDVESLESVLDRSSHLLTKLTRNVGIAAAVPLSQQGLDRLELMPLGERRVLVIVVTRDRSVRNRVVTLDTDLSAEELLSIRNYVNFHFSGWSLADIRSELEQRLRLQNAYYDALLQRLRALYQRGLLDIDLDPEVHLEGTSYLLSLDVHMTREKMRDLLRALEEKRRILQLLDRLLDRPEGEVGVHVGLEEVHPAMKELSLIGIRVTTRGGAVARVAVLGPMRMHYERVMSAVLSVGTALQRVPS